MAMNKWKIQREFLLIREKLAAIEESMADCGYMEAEDAVGNAVDEVRKAEKSCIDAFG